MVRLKPKVMTQIHHYPNLRMIAGGNGHTGIARIDTPAGEDELARHEGVPLVALAHKHAQGAAAAVQDQQGRGILGADIGVARVALGFLVEGGKALVGHLGLGLSGAAMAGSGIRFGQVLDGFGIEAMHVERPLQANQSTFDGPQEAQ